MGIALSGPPQLRPSLGSVPAKMLWTRRRASCLLPSPHPSTGPDQRVLVLWIFQRTVVNSRGGPSPKTLERSVRRGSLLHPRLGNRPTSTSMDTGYQSLLTLLPPPLLRQKLLCLVPTLGIASHLGIRVGRAVALMNVAEAIDLREIARSQGEIAAAGGLPLDLDTLPGTDIIEMPRPGGETEPAPTTNELLWRVLFLPLIFGRRTFERAVYYESFFLGACIFFRLQRRCCFLCPTHGPMT